MSTLEKGDFEDLLEYLKLSRGYDLGGYKRVGLQRRVRKRMQMLEIENFTDYIDYLEVHPEEFSHLFNTLLINVTAFFRDRLSWDYIMSEIIPRIAARKERHEPIRIWSAGCASGEEAYTLAMAMGETLGIDHLRDRVKIYATDLDDEALTQGRAGIYTAKQVTGLSPEYLERYFEKCDQGYVFRKDLRRAIIFGRHDLMQDAPISRLELLVCRNALMYFNAETQAKILDRFHFALNDGGYLFLGKAEMLLTHTATFTPMDLQRRVFIKAGKVKIRDHVLSRTQNGRDEVVNYVSASIRIREAAFDAGAVAQIIVDFNNFVCLINEQARNKFGLTPKDINRPLQDLELSYQPVELRSSIDQVYSDRRIISLKEVEWTNSSGELNYLDVQVSPLTDINSNLLGVSVTFTDTTRYKHLQQELEHSNQELEMAYEELQSTNEELETTNEELQSTNEELETTNEELQSTNEELETMNEELQSTNEELHTINDEVRQRSEELDSANAFLESIFISWGGGVVVLNRELQIQIWNYKAEDLWGLRTDEVQGTHFLNLEIGLPVSQLKQPIRNCLSGMSESAEVTLSATNRRGKAIECKVTCTPLVDSTAQIRGVTVLMEPLEGE